VAQLVELWRAYNLHLHHVMSHADQAKLNTPCTLHTLQEIAFKTVPKSEPVTLEYLMKDYVDHLKHHLAQISNKQVRTPLACNSLRHVYRPVLAMSSFGKNFRVGILISGRGSNMVALIDAAQAGMIPSAEVTVVISDQPAAGGPGESPRAQY